MSTELIVSLDGHTLEEAEWAALHLKDKCWGFKIHDLVLTESTRVVYRLKSLGVRVFVDLKFWDIPFTVHRHVILLAKEGADIISVHGIGEKDMLKAAVEASAGRSQIAAVILMSSTPFYQSHSSGIELDRMVDKVKAVGISTLIRHGSILRQFDVKEIQIITPAIRPSWYDDLSLRYIMWIGLTISIGGLVDPLDYQGSRSLVSLVLG